MIAYARANALGEGFSPNSITHLLVVVVSFSIMAAFIFAGLRPKNKRRVELGWVWAIVISQIVHACWWTWWTLASESNANSGWGAFIREALPLQLCDLSAPLAAIALIWSGRWAWALLFYWGIGLSIWAFITPVLRTGPGHELFWMFWVNHIQIVGTAFYGLFVVGFRPRWWDFVRSFGILSLWALIVAPLNIFADANYGFMGRGGADGSPIDALGEWPLRIVPLFFIIMAGMAGMTAAGRLIPGGDRTGSSRSDADPAS